MNKMSTLSNKIETSKKESDQNYGDKELSKINQE